MILKTTRGSIVPCLEAMRLVKFLEKSEPTASPFDPEVVLGVEIKFDVLGSPADVVVDDFEL